MPELRSMRGISVPNHAQHVSFTLSPRAEQKCNATLIIIINATTSHVQECSPNSVATVMRHTLFE